ncbi:MAG: flavodoxin domain-containing protein [Bacillota bacterium]|nr:flavodoxin domain-containing protein [Bacillota bacterium]
MKTIVVYQSSTGFTKQYGEWIAEELDVKVVSLKEAAQQEIKDADLVIFGGWVFGGTINGLEDMRKKGPARLIVYAVGAMPSDLVDIEALKKESQLEDVPFFYMSGGMRFEKLNFAVKGMLKMMRKSLVKKKDKSPQDEFMAEALKASFDNSDKGQIAALVEYCRKI